MIELDNLMGNHKMPCHITDLPKEQDNTMAEGEYDASIKEIVDGLIVGDSYKLYNRRYSYVDILEDSEITMNVDFINATRALMSSTDHSVEARSIKTIRRIIYKILEDDAIDIFEEGML